MKTNSRIKPATTKNGTTASKTSDNYTTGPNAANGQNTIITPDYSSMEMEVQKISHPIPFNELKEFYGIN